MDGTLSNAAAKRPRVTRNQVLRIAAASFRDPRTVERAIRGEAGQASTDAVTEVAKTLGIELPARDVR
jgi:hypothetical protein